MGAASVAVVANESLILSLALAEASLLEKRKGVVGSCADKALSEIYKSDFIDCMICLEAVPQTKTCQPSLPLDIAALSECSTSARASAAGGCKHNICSMCAAEYIRIELNEHKYPIRCAHPGCMWAFGLDDVSKVIRHDAKRLALVQRLAVEAGMKNRVYCPHAQCEAVMDIPNPKGKIDCINCHRPFCATCRTDWHAGYSCEEYQALPDHLRTAEDLQMLRLAHQKLWRRCPNCKHMVERNPEGCNFMMCRCKAAFCYQCGVAYINLDANANNSHGRPGCQCGLFERPA